MLIKSAIMIVDYEPAPHTAMLDAITRRYDRDYGIISHLTPHVGLDDLERVKANGEQVALLIPDP